MFTTSANSLGFAVQSKFLAVGGLVPYAAQGRWRRRRWRTLPTDRGRSRERLYTRIPLCDSVMSWTRLCALDLAVALREHRTLGPGRLIGAGYIPYRLGIESVKLLPEPDDDTGKLLDALKKSLDPNNILAPGRYGLGTGDTSKKETDARAKA